MAKVCGAPMRNERIESLEAKLATLTAGVDEVCARVWELEKKTKGMKTKAERETG